MDLSKRILESISLGIKQGLNEGRKSIRHRTIDRRLWLSVQSIISRNKSTEAEFIKPMKKLTKDDLLNRYVAALLIMKKPCPKNEADIEKIKTLKLFAQKALQMGATIQEIQDLYDVNSGESTQPVKKAFDPKTVEGRKLNPREQYAKQQFQDRLDTLVDKELSGKYLYKYYTTYGHGYGSNGLTVGSRELKDNERRYVLGTYVFSNEEYNIFVTEYQELITVRGRDRWSREIASKVMLGKEGMNLNFVPKLHETESDAMDDHNGMENTAVCTQFNDYSVFPTYFSFDKVVHRSNWGDESYLSTKAAYIPALGELIDAFAIPKIMKDVKGTVWSSTFKDPTHVYGFDGKKVYVLDLEKDSAYLVPFIAIKKGETKISYETEVEHFPAILGLKKDDYIKQDKSNYLRLAKEWNMAIIESEYKAIENRVKQMSNYQLETEIIKLLKKGVGNANRSDEKGFYKKGLYDNHWNMMVKGLVYSSSRLYVKYWTGGDSTDSDDWIRMDDLIGRHTDETAGTRFSFDSEAKTKILVDSCTLLMYWDKQIKKYS